MKTEYDSSQISPSGLYIASYIQRTDPVDEYRNNDPSYEPWAIWENRILIKAHNPDEALSRTMEHIAAEEYEYKNVDGVEVRNTAVGLTSLIPIYDELEDGNEIEWFDHTGESVTDMNERIVGTSKLEAFTSPDDARKIKEGEDSDAEKAV